MWLFSSVDEHVCLQIIHIIIHRSQQIQYNVLAFMFQEFSADPIGSTGSDNIFLASQMIYFLIHCINNILRSLSFSPSQPLILSLGSCFALFKFGHCDKILSLGPLYRKMFSKITDNVVFSWFRSHLLL